MKKVKKKKKYVYNTVLNLKNFEQVEIIGNADYNNASAAFCGTRFDSVLRCGITIKIVKLHSCPLCPFVVILCHSI